MVKNKRYKKYITQKGFLKLPMFRKLIVLTAPNGETVPRDFYIEEKVTQVVNVTDSNIIPNAITVETVDGDFHVVICDNFEKAKNSLKLLAEKEHALENKNIQLNIDVPENVTIEGDCVMIKSAIANLLENAIHFSQENSTIHLAAEHSEGQTTITLTDQGPGIPDYALPRVFERFYSISKPNTSQKSSGLGLSFVKEIIDLHQGSISIENRTAPDKGACVTIMI